MTGSFLDTFLGTTDNRPLVFKTNNVERFRLLSNGNTGIGTTNPQSPLHVAGAAGIIIGTSALDGGYTALKFSLSQASGGYALIQAIKSAGGAYGDLNLNPVGGSVGIGTINPVAKLEVNNGGGTGASLKLEHSGSNFIVRSYEAGSNTTVLENTSGYLYINSNIGVLKSPATNTALNVAGGQKWSIYAAGDIFASTGYSDNGYYLTSDARFKRNIETVPDALSHLLALRGVTYEMNRAAFPDRNFTEGKHLGFIAQEMEKVLPQLVKTGKDGFKAVNYEGVIPVTVEAIKTLNARTLLQQNQMEALSKENAAIKADNAEMKAELDALKSAVRQLQQNRK